MDRWVEQWGCKPLVHSGSNGQVCCIGVGVGCFGVFATPNGMAWRGVLFLSTGHGEANAKGLLQEGNGRGVWQANKTTLAAKKHGSWAASQPPRSHLLSPAQPCWTCYHAGDAVVHAALHREETGGRQTTRPDRTTIMESTSASSAMGVGQQQL